MRVPQYLLICVVIIAMLTGVVSAKQPTYGKADLPLDGWPDEWNLATDFWGDMSGTSAITGKTAVYAKAYVRYDCDTNTVYILVIDVDGGGLLLHPDISVSVDNTMVSSLNIVWDYFTDETSDPYAYGYEASFQLAPASYGHFVIENLYIDGSEYIPVATVDQPLTITCGALPSPEFPSVFLPVTMIIGFLGAVLLIQRTREH